MKDTLGVQPSDVDFDPFNPALVDRPRAYAELASRSPVSHVQGRFDFFIQSDPAYIRNILFRDTSIWTSERGVCPTNMPPENDTRMLRDNEDHLRIRRIIQRGFAPAELKRLGLVVDEIADDLIDRMELMPEGQGNFYDLLAMPLAARLMCRMLGAPESDHIIYKNWADTYFYGINNDPDFTPQAQYAAMQSVTAALFGLIGERRAFLGQRGLAGSPDLIGRELPNDFLSRFMCERINGENIGDVEILSLMTAIILGGNETTMMLICNLLYRLLEEPAHWEAIKADPSLIETAIEESLRFDPPVLGMCRTPRHDIEVCGVSIPAGAKTFYNISAVNRDPEVWADPHEFRLDRPLAQLRHHASFSGGERLCLGAGLARMEVRRVFEKLIARFPRMRLAGPADQAPGFNVWGKAKLPVAWN